MKQSFTEWIITIHDVIVVQKVNGLVVDAVAVAVAAAVLVAGEKSDVQVIGH